MTLVLRKCKSDGSSRNNFFYGQVGERVTCPDWKPDRFCGNGLHGLKEGNGLWNLLEGDDWLIIDADDQIVDIDNYKCKFNTGIIKYRGSADDIINSEEFHRMARKNEKFCHTWAYLEKIHINILANYISSSNWAYWWARDVGNHDIMIDKIKYSGDAYWWAICIGNQDIMKAKVTYQQDDYWITLWNRYFKENKIEV